MKKLIAFVLVIVLCLGLMAGCGGKKNEQYFVGALYDSLQVESRVRQKNALESYAAELGMKLVFQDAALDEKKQMEQAENLIAQGVDAIIVLAHNAEAMTPLADMCKKEGVTLLVTDRLISNCEYDYFVGLDNDAVGEIQSTYALERVPEGNYILIEGAPTDPNAIQWSEIWNKNLAPYVESGAINIVFEEMTTDWDATINRKKDKHSNDENDTDENGKCR